MQGSLSQLPTTAGSIEHQSSQVKSSQLADHCVLSSCSLAQLALLATPDCSWVVIKWDGCSELLKADSLEACSGPWHQQHLNTLLQLMCVGLPVLNKFVLQDTECANVQEVLHVAVTHRLPA